MNINVNFNWIFVVFKYYFQQIMNQTCIQQSKTLLDTRKQSLENPQLQPFVKDIQPSNETPVNTSSDADSQDKTDKQNDKGSSNNIKSQEELKSQFEENEKKLTKLSSNIDDLFKKISSLTEEVETQITNKPLSKLSTSPKLDNKSKSQTLIDHQYKPAQRPHNFITVNALSQLKRQTSLEEDGGLSMKMFDIGKSIGYGKFGQVFQCRNKQTGALYALKKIFKSTIEQYQMHQQLLTELSCCALVNHPNIMKSYAAFTDSFHIFLISEYLQGKRLTKKFNSPESYVGGVVRQVLEAVKYLHQIGIVHRDLKPENIIVDDADNIKICDFGWANKYDSSEEMFILCGTLDYVCPEMAHSQKYSQKVDLWSVGVLTYELIFGIAPFKQQDRESTFQRVKLTDIKFPEEKPISSECKDFITKLLTVQEERMDIESSLAHPYVLQNHRNETNQIDNEIQHLF